MVKYLVALLGWVDERFPVSKVWNEHLAKYYAPKNFNFWYFFGSLAMLVLVLQLLTGLWLTMHYKPDATLAFDSVEYIMRDVNWGWLIRYLHSTGASAFFIVVYMHMFRGMMYGSYKKPREVIWLLGMAMFLALMGEAFMGYLLPWGQMSYWGAQVIISLFGAIPWVGEALAQWIRGDYLISDATLNRFFAFHVMLIPLILVVLVYVHIVALHHVGSNNPDGIEIKKHKNADGVPVDGIPFHPYYTVKDLVGVAVFALVFAWVVFYAPEMNGLFLEYANFIPANPIATPEHIAPVWYFTPFYSILRAVPNKLGGVIAMFSAIILLFLLPWLDRCRTRSIRYRSPFYKIGLGIFTVSFLGLGYLGTQPVTPAATLLAQLFSLVYFVFFLAMPVYSRWDQGQPVPERLTPNIPILERPGLPWCVLRWLVDKIQAHPQYQKLMPVVTARAEDVYNKLPPFIKVQVERFCK
ncbi:MAG: cytochrome b [Methylococcaceae bacterium]|nr:MAG: cytochrome b [Methylococcaceae bacterium]